MAEEVSAKKALRVIRHKSAQLLFADTGDLDRLVQEAEFPEEFLMRFEGPLEATAERDFAFLLDRTQFLALDQDLIMGGRGRAADGGLSAEVAERYRRNLCQRLSDGTFIRIAVLRRSPSDGRVRHGDQRRLVEWFHELARSIEHHVQADTRGSIRATVILLFDRPLDRGDVLFLRQLRQAAHVGEIYVVSERFRATVEGRGLIHSRYVWPRMVTMLLARLAAERSERWDWGQASGVPVIAWRALALRVDEPAASWRGQIVDITRVFKGEGGRSALRSEEAKAAGGGSDWVPARPPVSGDDPTEVSDLRTGSLLGESKWKQSFRRAISGFHVARLTSRPADAARRASEQERTYWATVREKPAALWDPLEPEDSLNATARLDEQRAGVHATEQSMRAAERACSVALLAAEQWRRACDARVALVYRFGAALVTCVMLGLPAWQLFHWMRGEDNGVQEAPLVFLSALLCAVLGSFLAALLSWRLESRILERADMAQRKLLDEAVELRWKSFQTAAQRIQAADEFREKVLRHHARGQRRRLVERARRVVELGLRDARVDVVEDAGASFVGIPSEELPLAREDRAEFDAATTGRLDVTGVPAVRSGMSAVESQRPGDFGVTVTSPDAELEDRTDASEAAVGALAGWAAELPNQDPRFVGRLPARWLRALVARLARGFRFNHIERIDLRWRKRLKSEERLTTLAADQFHSFLNQHMGADGRLRLPLLSVETAGGGEPHRRVVICAGDLDVAQDIMVRVRDDHSVAIGSDVALQPRQTSLLQIGAVALCIEEVRVMIALDDGPAGVRFELESTHRKDES